LDKVLKIAESWGQVGVLSDAKDQSCQNVKVSSSINRLSENGLGVTVTCCLGTSRHLLDNAVNIEMKYNVTTAHLLRPLEKAYKGNLFWSFASSEHNIDILSEYPRTVALMDR
jgi:hypothetical protein